jgi:hypothetical protein
VSEDSTTRLIERTAKPSQIWSGSTTVDPRLVASLASRPTQICSRRRHMFKHATKPGTVAVPHPRKNPCNGLVNAIHKQAALK